LSLSQLPTTPHIRLEPCGVTPAGACVVDRCTRTTVHL
jgi:hypothetical protein